MRLRRILLAALLVAIIGTGVFTVLYYSPKGENVPVTPEPVAYNSTDISLTYTKDWDENWTDVENHTLCATTSTGYLTLELDFQINVQKSNITSIDLESKWATKNILWLYKPARLWLYNFSGASWRMISSHSNSTGIWDETFTDLNLDYINSSGLIRLKMTAQGNFAGPVAVFAFDYASISLHSGSTVTEIFASNSSRILDYSR